MGWGELNDSKLLVPISLGLVINSFDITDGPIFFVLIVYRITSLQHEGLYIVYPQNFDGKIIKVAVVYIRKDDLIVYWFQTTL